MIDIGANLGDKSFQSDYDAVIDRALAVGIEQLFLTGSTVPVSERSLEIARTRPGILYSTAGVHPHWAADCGEDFAERLAALLEEPEVVAVGECGLDFFRDVSPRDAQERCLLTHFDLAEKTGLPVYIHDREASERLIPLLREHRGRLSRAVVHCFTGQAETLDAYLELDLYIGITGWICDERRGMHLRSLIDRVPADRLMIETDAPYLMPRTIRPKPKSRRNEPAFLPYVLEMVAESVGRPATQVAEETTRTARDFFAVPAPAVG